MNNGPALWDRILDPVRHAFGSGVIAGGAVRDFMLGVTPKDIDVFVNIDSSKVLAANAKLLPVTFKVALMTELTEYETAPDWQSEVRGVLDGVYLSEPNDVLGGDFSIQIIARPMADFSGDLLVEQFDLGITRSWYDGSTIRDTSAAVQDRENKTMTLMRWDTPEHVASSMKRAERISQRLGLRFVDPRPATDTVLA